MKKWLLGNTPDELKSIVLALSLPPYTAGQIAQWIYKKKVGDIALMSNLSKSARELLSSEYEVGGFASRSVAISDDGTKKYLFRSLGEGSVEAVVIPDRERVTLCLSSQAGCRMACRFCMTGRIGFKGNLTAGEIISQVINVKESDSLTNIVYMGMGEPLDNLRQVLKSTEILTAEWGFAWSPRRITVSTIGVLPALQEFLDRSKCHLALSVHNPFDDERADFMPVQRAWPLYELISLIKKYDFTGQRRVSFEYIMFSGWNDSKRHADELIKMLRGLECRVNLIRYHAIPEFPFKSSPDVVIENFKTRLNNAGILATVRASRGEDILAACGMLSGNSKK